MSRKTDLIFNNVRKNVLHTLHPLQTLFIEINSTCNLNCRHCYIPEQLKQSVLPFTEIEKIVNLVSSEFGNSVGIAITGGEPLLHPDFNKIVNILEKKSFNWSLATNGLLLTSKDIDLLIKNNCTAITISLDGNEKTHEIQRKKKGVFKKVIGVIEMLIEKRFPLIYITATIHDDNIDSLNDIYKLMAKYNDKLRWRINPLLYCDNVEKNNLKISKDTYIKICEFSKKVKNDLGQNIIIGEKNPLSIKHTEYLYSEFDSCFAGISTFGVLANGDIVNCMVCREKVLGNISKVNSLKNIWEKQDLRQKGLCERHLESKKSLYK